MINQSMTKILVGSLSDFPDRLGKTVCVGEKEVALFKIANEKIYAVENRCPHKGGVLSEGMVSGKFVFCPMHDWKICLDDGKVQEPDNGCVKTYKTIINEKDEIFIVIED